MLQPFDHDAAEHKRHKFMVQTMFVGDEAEDVEDLVGLATPFVNATLIICGIYF